MISPVLCKLLPWRNGGKCTQIFMAVMVNIPMISLGMILGWVSPMQALLQSTKGPLAEPLGDDIISWMASVTFITSVPMEFLMGFLADKYGRKSCMQITSLSLMVSWFIKLVGLRPWTLILARGIAGVACAGCFVVIPLYIKEISDDGVRGALGSLLILSQNLGYLVIYVAGDMMSYRTMCWFIKLVGLRPWTLILARGIAGVACAGCFVVIPLYIKEISDDGVRGALGSLLILSQNFGYLVIYVAGDVMSYRTVNWLCFAIPAAHFVLFFVMPETPSFLIKKGKSEEALSVLSWLRCSLETDKTVLEELHQLQMEERQAYASNDHSLKTIENDKAVVEELHQLKMDERLANSSNKSSFMTIVTDKTTFKAFRVTLAVMLAQECCGYLVVLMYASLIFERAASSGGGLQLSPNKQAIVLGVVQLVGSVVASSVVEKTGRKLLLATTSCITGVAMLALGVWFYLTSMNVWLPGWLPISAMCLCIFCDAAGFQPTPYVIMSEMFSFQHRGTVTSFCIAACSAADFVQIKAFGPLSRAIGIHTTFWMFALLCFAGTTYTVVCVPETRGRSVEEIYALLGAKGKKKKEAEVQDNKV